MCTVLLKASERKQSCDSSLWSDGTSVGMPIALHGDAVPVPLRATVRPLEAPQQSHTWSSHGEATTPVPTGSAATRTAACGGPCLSAVCVLPLPGFGVADTFLRAIVWRDEVPLAPWVGCVDARTHEDRQAERARPDAALSSTALARRCEVRSRSCHRRRLRGSGDVLRAGVCWSCGGAWGAALGPDPLLSLGVAAGRAIGTSGGHERRRRLQSTCFVGHVALAVRQHGILLHQCSASAL